MAKNAPDSRRFLQRQIFHFAVALALLAISLGGGMLGYHHFEDASWRDAFLNAAMLLGGEGPIQQDLSDAGKVFAGVYALYSGLLVIVVTGLVLAPGVHHLMRRAHWEARDSD